VLELGRDFSWSRYQVGGVNDVVVAQLGRAFGMAVYDIRSGKKSAELPQGNTDIGS
jgi:hypothetical protein